MSSKLKRKPKVMEPVGFEREHLSKVATANRAVHNRAKFREDAYQNLKLIAYQVLHDRYGFGRKRISVVNDKINSYIVAAGEAKLGFNGLKALLEEKWKIDTAEEANKVPFRFSARQIKEVYAHIRDYINTLSRYKQFALKMEHIAESVAVECGYKDKRFIKG